MRLRPRVLPFDPISERTHKVRRSRKKCYTFSFFSLPFFRIADEKEKEGKGGKRREAEGGSRMLPERRDASSFDDEQTHRPLTRRPTLRVAYLRRTDGHTREKPPRAAPRDVTRVSLVKEPERRQARESLGRR